MSRRARERDDRVAGARVGDLRRQARVEAVLLHAENAEQERENAGGDLLDVGLDRGQRRPRNAADLLDQHGHRPGERREEELRRAVLAQQRESGVQRGIQHLIRMRIALEEITIIIAR